MELQTVYPFRLPRGYVDEKGEIHRDGEMRLATMADEIMPMNDPRVRQNPEFLTVILLSRVVTRLGTLPVVTPEVIGALYTADANFLQNMYQTINDAEDPVIHVTCPHCGKEFTDTVNFTEMG
ncbi:hypothetical protein RWV98_05180 [Agathobaculum sp. NTUH-O15-33]|uniref:hypothetical protein n=1 Tax=Agathobaculum sp. NTUH-O15-33 TaxID=3079302 RepID=UPI0029584A68|nr:hypothetical protein [Agathobaculum sp. NTUH-O15-33]WNX85670.1 hypothetical protein RWV98_05180 [Agathobaculum sp. NTUH-O15-33]